MDIRRYFASPKGREVKVEKEVKAEKKGKEAKKGRERQEPEPHGSGEGQDKGQGKGRAKEANGKQATSARRESPRKKKPVVNLEENDDFDSDFESPIPRKRVLKDKPKAEPKPKEKKEKPQPKAKQETPTKAMKRKKPEAGKSKGHVEEKTQRRRKGKEPIVDLEDEDSFDSEEESDSDFEDPIPKKRGKRQGKEKEKPTKKEKEKETRIKLKAKPKKLESESEEEDLVVEEKVTPKRKGNPAAFASYLQRDGPQNLGAKEWPQPVPFCLEGHKVCITGVMETIEKGAIVKLLTDCGAKVAAGISKGLTYLIIGRDAGPAKLQKSEEWGLNTLDEDSLHDFLVEKTGGKGLKKEKDKKQNESAIKPEPKGSPNKGTVSPKTKVKPEPEVTYTKVKEKSRTQESVDCKPASSSLDSQSSQSSSSQSSVSLPSSQSDAGQMLVDKYRPRTVKHIVGQQGEGSNAHKLKNWLEHWYENLGEKPKFKPQYGNDDGAGYKAALLSGPPGVGKTTAAQLVCKETGYSFCEMNASDTRSKKSLEEEIATLLGNKVLTNYFTVRSVSSSLSSKHVLIMDEVDGMAGNEDRGGMAELIQLIKKTKVPIICICNDRFHQKIKSLANHCFDLRFNKPRVEQIKAAMMTVCFKEGIDISGDALQEMIVSTNQDVRQVLHYLNLVSSQQVRYQSHSKETIKDIRLGPFEAIRKVFETEKEANKMNFNAKSDLFFTDYNMMPLMVHQNYLKVTGSTQTETNKMKAISRSVNAMAFGDIVEKRIRTSNTWSLLPVQAAFSVVFPGTLMKGSLYTLPMFPEHLGKMSTYNKRDRLLGDLKVHMNLRISGSKMALNLDYMEPLREAITRPLIKKGASGVEKTLEFMNHYFLRKDDLETITELSLFRGQTDPMTRVESKVKAALTRTLNKESQMLPYAVDSVKKARKGAVTSSPADSNEGLEEGEGAPRSSFEASGDEEEEEKDGDNIEIDPTIKVKKVVKKESKGKGKAKGNDESDDDEKESKPGKAAPAKRKTKTKA